MVAGELLEVGEEDLVPGPDDDGGTELERPAAGLVLAVSGGQRAGGSQSCGRLQSRQCGECAGAHDLRGLPVLVEKDGKGNLLVFDERLCIALASGPDRGHTGPGGEEVVVSAADLTGPLAAGESAEVAEKEEHVGGGLPEPAQAMGRAVGGRKFEAAEGGNVKGHRQEGIRTAYKPRIHALGYSATVTAPRKAAVGGLLAWAGKRRFPTLLLITGTLFVIDLVVPDFIPLADELLLGLATLILARWKDSRKGTDRSKGAG